MLYIEYISYTMVHYSFFYIHQWKPTEAIIYNYAIPNLFKMQICRTISLMLEHGRILWCHTERINDKTSDHILKKRDLQLWLIALSAIYTV